MIDAGGATAAAAAGELAAQLLRPPPRGPGRRPAEKWARRISGVFGNQLAVESPAQAHAVLTAKPEGGYLVSVRAPLVARSGADELCSQFDSGGGGRGAAGINHLPESELGRVGALFFKTFD